MRRRIARLCLVPVLVVSLLVGCLGPGSGFGGTLFLPLGLFGAPAGHPDLEAPHGLRMGQFATYASVYLMLIASANGFFLLDLLTNELLHEYGGSDGTFDAANHGGPYFGAVAASQGPGGEESAAMIFAFGAGGWVLQRYQPDGWQTPIDNQAGATFDALPAGGDSMSDIVTFVQPSDGVRFIAFNPSSGVYELSDETLDAQAFEGELVSAYLHDDSITTKEPILVVARAVESGLYLDERNGEAPTRVAELGLDARKIRCTEAGEGTGNLICGVSIFGDDRVAILLWDGESAPTLAGFADVGDGPVDLDLRALASGNVALVSTGFNDNTLTETVVGPDGSVVSSDTRGAPEGCLNPGHAVYEQDDQGLKVVGTCYSSDNYFIVDSAL